MPHWENTALRVSGRAQQGRWTAVAKQVLTAKGYGYVTFRLAKWGGFACVGLTQAGETESDKLLCHQQKAIALDTNSSLYINGKKITQFDSSIVQGSIIRMEWKPRGYLVFWIDCDKLYEHQGEFSGWSFAVSGYDDVIAWEIHESDA